MISKELLSEVLGLKIPQLNKDKESWLCVSKVGSFTIGKEYKPISTGKNAGLIIDDTGGYKWQYQMNLEN